MNIKLSQLALLQPIEKVIIHSLNMSIYQASILLDGEEHFVVDNNGKLLRSDNIVELQELLANFKILFMVLRHESPYDEMIGQPVRQGPNTLEVPLGIDN